MKTLVRGGWVVGYDGAGHELLPEGVVVYEDDRIVHVGHGFDGPVDRTIDARGRLVSSGPHQLPHPRRHQRPPRDAERTPARRTTWA